MLYPIQRNRLWGYIDRGVNLVVQPSFDSALPMRCGFSAFKSGERWGFINAGGAVVCPPTYRKVGFFENDLCWIQDDTGFAVIDADFRILFRINAGEPVALKNGIIVIKEPDATYAYAQRDGRVFLHGNQGLEHFSEGLVAFQTEVPGKYGYKNLDGEWALEPRFDSASTFAEGIAAVGTRKKRSEVIGFIDKKGQLKIPYQFESIMPQFSNGRAKIWKTVKKEELVGYIDYEGNFVIEPQFENGEAFSSGLAAVQLAGKWGWVDLDGRWICQPKFEIVHNDLTGPLFWARHEKVLGYYSREGELLIASDPFPK